MNNSVLRISLTILLGFVFGAGVAYWQLSDKMQHSDHHVSQQAMTTEQQSGVVTGASIGGAFDLIDHHGNTVTNESWPGAYKLVFFGFTNCPDICPAGLQKIATVLETLGDQAEKIQPLLITVDPQRDTPEVMAEYIVMFDQRIIGLTGSQEQIDRAVSAYKVYAAITPVQDENAQTDEHHAEQIAEEESSHTHHAHEGHDMPYQVNHSGYMYLMSPEDQLLEIFKTQETTDSMLEKIKRHL